MIKAVIFDMDGVVVDSTSYDFAAWKRLFSEFGLELSFATYKSFLGMLGRDIVKKLMNRELTKNEAKTFEDKKEQYFIEAVGKGDLKAIDGLLKFLDELVKANYELALATAGSRMKVAAVLKKLNLEKYFGVIVTADDVIRGKPSPDIFLKAAEGLKYSPAECIVIEDAPNGVAAAKAAGMKCIAITTTHEGDELKSADKIIGSFDELTAEMLQAL